MACSGDDTKMLFLSQALNITGLLHQVIRSSSCRPAVMLSMAWPSIVMRLVPSCYVIDTKYSLRMNGFQGNVAQQETFHEAFPTKEIYFSG